MIALVVAVSGCQTVVESGDDTALPPLGTPALSIVATSTTAATTSTSTTTPPLTTTTVAPTTVPAPTTTTTVPAITTTTSTTSTTTTSSTSSTTSTTVPTSSTTTTTEPFYSDEPSTGTLSEGDRGDRTKAMQAKLVTLGYLNPGADDGLFGKVTTAAVEQFQNDNDLEVDGLVGPNTSAALDAAVDAT